MRNCKLPVLDETILDRIDIAKPCPASWEAMRGDHHVRFCAGCRKHVYDLSTLGRSEAVALIARHEGKLCVRLLRRPDGRLVTDDCAARLRAARQRGLLPFVAALVVVGLIQLGAHLMGLRAAWNLLTTSPDDARPMAGAMVMPPDPVEPLAPLDDTSTLGSMTPNAPEVAPHPSLPLMGKVAYRPVKPVKPVKPAKTTKTRDPRPVRPLGMMGEAAFAPEPEGGPEMGDISISD